MADVTHKLGDTFVVNGLYKNASGTPVNLTAAGITVASAVRGGGQKLMATVTYADQNTQPGRFTLRWDTTAWPVGTLRWDVRYTQPSGVRSTRTMAIEVVQGVT